MRKEQKKPFTTVSRIRRLFLEEPERMAACKNWALEIDQLQRILFPILDYQASVVCSACLDPCCLEKEAYFQVPDLLFISALGHESPDSAGPVPPKGCRFFFDKGCTLPRPSRPFVCNEFFCEPFKNTFHQESQEALFHIENLFSEIRVLRRRLQNAYLGIYEGDSHAV